MSGTDPHAGAGLDRVALSGPDGRPVAVVSPQERDGVPWADLVWTPPGSPVAHTAAALLEAFATAYASVETADLRDALVRRGATLTREAHSYTRDLDADPPPPEWLTEAAPPEGCTFERLRAEPDPADLDGLVDAFRAAFGAGHPDHEPGDRAHTELAVRKMLRGEVLGPLLPGATLARALDGQVVGALILTDRPGPPPYGGPWVTDIYRLPGPQWAGLGAALLRRGLARTAADGRSSVGLVVTGDNPARRVYERLGFRLVSTSWTLRLPAAEPPPA